MTTKLKTTPTPEELFSQAVGEAGPDLSDGDMRLLLSGLTALREYREKRVNERELKAINSMIAYIAYRQAVQVETVEAVLTTTFNVTEVRALPSSHYNDVIAYLIDLQIAKTFN